MKKVLVSACLFGENCKYSGGNNLRNNLLKELEDCEVTHICPECMGGLATPRDPSEIEMGFDGSDVVEKKAKVLTCNGADVTEEFLRGAQKALETALEKNVQTVYLKQGSPSCGCGLIYNGAFSGTKKHGDGVTAALLKKNGFEIVPVE